MFAKGKKHTATVAISEQYWQLLPGPVSQELHLSMLSHAMWNSKLIAMRDMT